MTGADGTPAEGGSILTDALREAVIAIARTAAGAVLEVYDSDFAVAHKDDRSPLTAADLAAHHAIVDGLARATPGVPVLSEESANEVAATQRLGWPRLWVVDPLDGTREFIKRNGEFTVNIALVEHGVATFGVVLAPVTGVVWHGGASVGACRRAADGERELHVRVPATAPLRVSASRSHRDARTEAFLAAMGDIQVIGLGSSLKFCLVAEGGLDVYPRFGPTSEWDTAAAQAVLEGAGGQVIDTLGRPFRYNRRDTIRNGDFIALGDPGLPWRTWLAG